MSIYPSNKIRTRTLLAHDTTAAVDSVGVNLANVHKVSIHCGIKQPPIIATAANALASAVSQAVFSVRVGHNSSATEAALAGSTLTLGMTTAAELTNWDAIQIGILGSLATAAKTKLLTFMGTQYTLTTAISTLAAGATQLMCKTLDGFCTSLDRVVAADYPELAIVSGASSTHFSSRIIKYKTAGGKGKISAATTVAPGMAAAASEPFVYGVEQSGVINFTPADVVATNSSYVEFAVRVSTASSAAKVAVALIDEKVSPVFGNATKV